MWTGGQYSLCRALLGLAIAAEAALVRGPESGPMALVTLVRLVAVIAALALALGAFDRTAAGVLLVLAAGLALLGILPANVGTLSILWLLATHLLIPASPYGARSARGRADPSGGWKMPRGLARAHRAALVLAWLVLAAHILRDGRTVWAAGGRAAPALAALAAVVWALSGTGAGGSRARAWGAALFVSTVLAWWMPEAGWGLALLHLFAFDPAWVPGAPLHAADGAAPADGPATLFYDGGCGLCHRAVRFALAEDPDGSRFAFAPLQGRHLGERLDARARAGLPDSLVLLEEGAAQGGRRVLTRSRAVRALLSRLGGYWRILALAAAAVPVGAGDVAYDAVARVRHALFAPPPEACPVTPPSLRERFRLD